MVANQWAPILQRWENLDSLLGTEFWVVRDDLLPFPLPGNKVRKIESELSAVSPDVKVIITNGGVDSNHCRTLAMFGAQRGFKVHLVLHGDPVDDHGIGLQILDSLGASYDIGPADTIADRISVARSKYTVRGKNPIVFPGGGHSPLGAKAFRDAGESVFKNCWFDQVFVASGTGATQGGLITAAEKYAPQSTVLGISVARDEQRGSLAVREAARWAGSTDPEVYFTGSYRAGGYGKADSEIYDAVDIAWNHGLPVDPTYTGKAFAAILDFSRKGELGSSVLFWHTGGLANWLTHSFSKVSEQK